MALETLPPRTLRVTPSHLSEFHDGLTASSRPLHVSRERIMEVAARSGDTFLWHIEPNTPYQESSLLRAAMDAASVSRQSVLAHGILGLIYALRRAFLQNPEAPIRGVVALRYTAPVFEGASIDTIVEPERDSTAGFEVISDQLEPGLVITGRIAYGPVSDHYETSTFSSLAEQQLFSLEEVLGAISALIGPGIQDSGGRVLYMGQRLELQKLVSLGDELEATAEIVERRPGKRAGERVMAAIAVREEETDLIAAGESIFLHLSQTD